MTADEQIEQMFEVPGSRLRDLSDAAAVAIDMAREGTGLYLDLLKATLTGMIYQDPAIPATWGEFVVTDTYREDLRIDRDRLAAARPVHDRPGPAREHPILRGDHPG